MSLYNELTQACSKEVTLRYSTSFFRAVNLLSPSIQQDIHNIYGFVRFADEIVDTFHEYNQKKLSVNLRKIFMNHSRMIFNRINSFNTVYISIHLYGCFYEAK